MSDVPSSLGPACPAEPDSAAAAGASRPRPSARLLGLVRQLIDYGKQLVGTLQQRATPDFTDRPNPFGTTVLVLIIARITRGLRIAAALEARLIRGAARMDAPPRPFRATCAHRTPAQRTARETHAQDDFPTLDRLPSAEEIAAQIKGRAIGQVIADICTDLGITPGLVDRVLWDEIVLAIAGHGGNFVRFHTAMVTRVLSSAIAAAEPTTEPAMPAPESPRDRNAVPLQADHTPLPVPDVPRPLPLRATGPPLTMPANLAA